MRAPLETDRVVHEPLLAQVDHGHEAPIRFLAREQSRSRAELRDRAARVAGGLREDGVAKGDRVALMLSNRPEFLEVWFACSLIGAIVVPLNTALRGDPLEHVLRLTAPTVVVAEREVAPNLSTTVEQLRDAIVVDCDDGAGTLVSGTPTPYRDLLAADAVDGPTSVEPWDPFAIMFTSGTTGPSKGVVWTHQTARTLADTAIHHLSYTDRDVVHTTLPLFHGNALMLSVYAGIVARATVAIGGRFSGSGFWREIVGCAATTTSLLGSMAQILWAQPSSPLEHQHALRLAMVIPGPPGDQYEVFEQRYGLRMTEAYGLTDIGMILWIPPGERHPGSCGKPTAGWQVDIVDEHDRPVPDGTVGEIVARPLDPYIAPLGYWRMPEATNDSRRNLWLHTGDLGKRDGAGWYTFVDRAKDAIRRRGENVSSFEVEQVILSHPLVADCAVYAVPSDLMEDEVMVAVVVEEGGDLTPEDLIAHCEPRLPYFAIPRYLRFVDALPRTKTEKVVKAVLRDQGVTEATWDREREGYELAR